MRGRGEHRSDVLWIELLGATREADQVREEDGDDLALLARGSSGLIERRGAGRTEPEALGALETAVRAGQHPASLGSRNPPLQSEHPRIAPERGQATGSADDMPAIPCAREDSNLTSRPIPREGDELPARVDHQIRKKLEPDPTTAVLR